MILSNLCTGASPGESHEDMYVTLALNEECSATSTQAPVKSSKLRFSLVIRPPLYCGYPGYIMLVFAKVVSLALIQIPFHGSSQTEASSCNANQRKGCSVVMSVCPA